MNCLELKLKIQLNIPIEEFNVNRVCNIIYYSTLFTILWSFWQKIKEHLKHTQFSHALCGEIFTELALYKAFFF